MKKLRLLFLFSLILCFGCSFQNQSDIGSSENDVLMEENNSSVQETSDTEELEYKEEIQEEYHEGYYDMYDSIVNKDGCCDCRIIDDPDYWGIFSTIRFVQFMAEKERYCQYVDDQLVGYEEIHVENDPVLSEVQRLSAKHIDDTSDSWGDESIEQPWICIRDKENVPAVVLYSHGDDAVLCVRSTQDEKLWIEYDIPEYGKWFDTEVDILLKTYGL